MSLRVLIAVTHLLGAGHLTRAAAIARALARAGHDITLVSGGRPSPLIPLDGVRLVQLPPVRALVDDFTTLRDETGQPIGPERLAARRDRLVGTFEAVRPDVVISELYPFGRRSLAGEFDALLDAALSARPRPLILSSVRDILVAPTKPGRAEAAERLVERSFDAVLVHGDPRLVPLEASWPVGAALRRRLVYTGYVDAGAGSTCDGPQPVRDGSVIVSGGSSAAGLPLYEAACAAAAREATRSWRILVGGGIAADVYADLERRAPGHVSIERARSDFRQLLRRASVFVGLAGYNTVMDLIATRIPAILVPFEQGRETEQRIRAETLARAGLAICLPEAALSGEALAGAVLQALEAPEPPRFEGGREGAVGTVRAIESLVRGGRSGTSPAGASRS